MQVYGLQDLRYVVGFGDTGQFQHCLLSKSLSAEADCHSDVTGFGRSILTGIASLVIRSNAYRDVPGYGAKMCKFHRLDNSPTTLIPRTLLPRKSKGGE